MRRFSVSIIVPNRVSPVWPNHEATPQSIYIHIKDFDITELYHTGQQLRVSLWADILRQREGRHG